MSINLLAYPSFYFAPPPPVPDDGVIDIVEAEKHTRKLMTKAHTIFAWAREQPPSDEVNAICLDLLKEIHAVRESIEAWAALAEILGVLTTNPNFPITKEVEGLIFSLALVELDLFPPFISLIPKFLQLPGLCGTYHRQLAQCVHQAVLQVPEDPDNARCLLGQLANFANARCTEVLEYFAIEFNVPDPDPRFTAFYYALQRYSTIWQPWYGLINTLMFDVNRLRHTFDLRLFPVGDSGILSGRSDLVLERFIEKKIRDNDLIHTFLEVITYLCGRVGEGGRIFLDKPEEILTILQGLDFSTLSDEQAKDHCMTLIGLKSQVPLHFQGPVTTAVSKTYIRTFVRLLEKMEAGNVFTLLLSLKHLDNFEEIMRRAKSSIVRAVAHLEANPSKMELLYDFKRLVLLHPELLEWFEIAPIFREGSSVKFWPTTLYDLALLCRSNALVLESLNVDEFWSLCGSKFKSVVMGPMHLMRCCEVLFKNPAFRNHVKSVELVIFIMNTGDWTTLIPLGKMAQAGLLPHFNSPLYLARLLNQIHMEPGALNYTANLFEALGQLAEAGLLTNPPQAGMNVLRRYLPFDFNHQQRERILKGISQMRANNIEINFELPEKGLAFKNLQIRETKGK